MTTPNAPCHKDRGHFLQLRYVLKILIISAYLLSFFLRLLKKIIKNIINIAAPIALKKLHLNTGFTQRIIHPLGETVTLK